MDLSLEKTVRLLDKIQVELQVNNMIQLADSSRKANVIDEKEYCNILTHLNQLYDHDFNKKHRYI